MRFLHLDCHQFLDGDLAAQPLTVTGTSISTTTSLIQYGLPLHLYRHRDLHGFLYFDRHRVLHR